MKVNQQIRYSFKGHVFKHFTVWTEALDKKEDRFFMHKKRLRFGKFDSCNDCHSVDYDYKYESLPRSYDY